MTEDVSPEGTEYEIRVKGHLGARSARRFEEYEPTAGFHDDGTPITILSGLKDQAALHGTLTKIRDLGIVIVSVSRIDK